MPYPSHIARSALRKALREHPQAETVLCGRQISGLPLSELYNLLMKLGLDPNAIASAALNAPVDAAACDNPPHKVAGGVSWPEPETETETETMPDTSETDAIEAELRTLRQLVGTGGFAALDDRLRELVTEARKPPVEVRVEVPAEAMVQGQAVPAAKPTGKSATWKALFGVRGELGRRETALWDGSHPNTPKVNDRYLWPHPQTEAALSQIARGRNVMLFGPAGTGKTEFAQQLAARTGRPFALISCDNGTDASTLVGLTVPDASGGVSWQDGALTKAIRTPGCVVCLDEPSVARPGALFVLQNVLANRQLFIAETGTKVNVANGVVFLATDNTNGTGGGARKGYTDTNRLNAAFLDRFGVRVFVDYLPPDAEAQVIVGYTGCTVELAKLLVSAATVTRAAASDQSLSHGIGLRRLLSWAELLVDGIDWETAFQAAILNAASEQDVETLREQILLSYDRKTVAAALNPSMPVAPDPTLTNPTPAGRSAAADFTNA